MSLLTADLKICPYCEQMLKDCYRYCIRCGQLYPVESIPNPAGPTQAVDLPAEEPQVAEPVEYLIEKS